MTKTCGNCAHWDAIKPATSRPSGSCRRLPPVPVVLTQAMNPPPNNNPGPPTITATQVQSLFPATYAEWVCGEHKQRLEVVG